MFDEEEKRQEIVNNAKKLLNIPFAHRGRTRFGIDCLGVCLISYRRAGFSHLPDGDGKIYPINWFMFEKDERYLNGIMKYFDKVEFPKPGDIVMFRCFAKKVTHGGIYIGNRDFIHARSGRKVQRNNLDEKYYYNRYAFSFRLKEFNKD